MTSVIPCLQRKTLLFRMVQHLIPEAMGLLQTLPSRQILLNQRNPPSQQSHLSQRNPLSQRSPLHHPKSLPRWKLIRSIFITVWIGLMRMVTYRESATTPCIWFCRCVLTERYIKTRSRCLWDWEPALPRLLRSPTTKRFSHWNPLFPRIRRNFRTCFWCSLMWRFPKNGTTEFIR